MPTQNMRLPSAEDARNLLRNVRDLIDSEMLSRIMTEDAFTPAVTDDLLADATISNDKLQDGGRDLSSSVLIIDANGEIPGSYTTFAAAYAASAEGDMLVLASNLTENISVTIDKNISLDLQFPYSWSAGPDGDSFVFDVTSGKTFSITGKGAVLGIDLSNPLTLIQLTSGRLQLYGSPVLFCFGSPGTVIDIVDTSPGLVFVGGTIQCQGGAGACINLPAGLGAFDVEAAYLRNLQIIPSEAASAGIRHPTSFADFPLYNSAITGDGTSLDNVTVAAGNTTNYTP